MKKTKNKVCLICSAGGHFLQLYLLKEFWEKYDHFWVTFPKEDTLYLLKNEKYYWAFQPTNRNIKNLLKNFILAIKIFSKEKPTIVISTGAGVCVPFIYLARMLGKKTIYIESATRIKDLSLSAKLIYPVVNYLVVQWKELESKYKKTKFAGRVI